MHLQAAPACLRHYKEMARQSLEQIPSIIIENQPTMSLIKLQYTFKRLHPVDTASYIASSCPFTILIKQ